MSCQVAGESGGKGDGKGQGGVKGKETQKGRRR